MCVGSKDMNTYVICAELCANLSIKPMGGLKDVVVGCFFLKESLDVSFVFYNFMVGMFIYR